MNSKTRLFNLLIIFALFLSACNLPSGDNQGEGLSQTAAAQTVEALLSATVVATNTSAVAPTITLIPSPIFTSTPVATATPNCPLAQFVTDVTIPDGTTMLPGQTFNKKWRLRNIGACAWNGYSLVFDSGESMNGPATKAIAAVNPGQEIDIDVDLKAPNTAGTYRSYWRLVTSGNVLVPIVSGYQGRAFYVEIKVVAPTNTSAPAFAVTSVSFTNTGGCNGFTATANVTVNGPGTVTMHWIRSDGAAPPVPPAMNFAAAGTQSVSISWNTSASGIHWFDLFIDSPNNQQFGRAQFTCP
jgi:hypothetical protein